jgi:hypothetical protein
LQGGLLSVARPLPATWDEWRQGINFNTECGGDVGYDDECVVLPLDVNAPVKSIATVGSVVEFVPFMLYRGAECSTWVSLDELLQLARMGYARGESKAVALQLQSDAANVGNPSLNSEALDLTPGGGAVDVVNTLSGLVSSICDCGMNDLVLHSHIRAIPFLLERKQIRWDETSGTWRHGPWPFVFDCYDNTGPGAVDEPVDGSEVWIYATGPVEIATSAEVVPDHSPTVRQNIDLQLVEHLSILRFDPCCVRAALARVF